MSPNYIAVTESIYLLSRSYPKDASGVTNSHNIFTLCTELFNKLTKFTPSP